MPTLCQFDGLLVDVAPSDIEPERWLPQSGNIELNEKTRSIFPTLVAYAVFLESCKSCPQIALLSTS